MRKAKMFVGAVALMYSSVFAQYLPLAGGTMTGNINMNGKAILNASQLGVGTATMGSVGGQVPKLDVRGYSALNGLRINGDDDNALYTESTRGIGFTSTNAVSNIRFLLGGTGSSFVKMVINGNGNVGIGTLAPTAKLEVIGTIKADKVQIKTWTIETPDYVFEKDYKLASLKEVESFVQANKHLPEIPSAKEMKANGVDLAEMNMKLLQKVEELTLHVIAQQKEIESIKKQMSN